jgi:hypothetical protein
MDPSPVPPDIALAGLRALATVCATGDGLTPLERGFIDGVQRHVLHTSFDLDTLAPIDGVELAQLVPPGELRERIVGAMVIAATIDGETSTDELAVIEGLARALDVKSDVLRVGQRLARHQFTLARIDIARRALLGYKVKEVLREDGLPGIIKQFLPMLGVQNKATAARYRALEAFPAGTAGRAYYDFILANGFSFPGEAHAGPEIIVIHDLLHVLGGYATTPEDEVLVAAFQAGTHHADQFHQLLFAIAQFHLGLSIAPGSTPNKLKVDPAGMLQALARGAQVPKDMWGEFKPWDHFARPLDELRRELRIDPRDAGPRIE